MFILRALYFFIFINFCLTPQAQNIKKLEMMKKEVLTAKNDSAKVNKLVTISNFLSNSDFNQAMAYAHQALEISETLNYLTGEVEALNAMANAYWFHSDYVKAQKYYFKAYRINDSIHDQKAIAFSLYNIGWIVCIQQNSYKDDKYLYKSLHIYQSLHDTDGLLKIYNALATYYSTRAQGIDDSKQYFDSAIVYFNKGIDLANRSKLYNHLGRIYGNLGDLFYQQKDYKTSRFYNEKGIEFHRRADDSSSITIGLVSLGLCDMETGNILSAISNFNFVYRYNEKHEIKDIQLLVLKALADSHYKLKKFKQGYDFYVEYVDLKQQLDKEAFSTNISDLQSTYSLEKSEANVEQLKQTNEIQELKNKKKSYFIVGLLGVAFVVIVVAIFLFRQNKQKQLTNTKLKEQNHIIAEKKLEIDNSIQYAKGIQQAILPNVQELTNQFPQSFVYYKPKDIVSGDFYWFGELDQDFYCIAADCTGHGVPGALMSIIGIDKIEQAIFEKRITKTGLILSFLNQQIKQVLKQHSDASKQMDGMDIALLKFNKTLSEVEYSGANRSFLLIRDKTIMEYKADKLAIGGFTAQEQIFSSTTVKLKKNDTLYIFTDGYADQFGGEEGKKFMSRNLKELLVSIADLPSHEQEQRIGEAFMGWKKCYEQVDDVLIIGLIV